MNSEFPQRSVGATAAVPAKTESDPTYASWHEQLRDGTRVLIRPITANDVELERSFVERLSPQSRRFRFLGEINLSKQMLRRLTQPDPASEVAFVALIAEGAQKAEIGVARYCTNADGTACECAVAVSDEWHNKGLGSLLMRHLIDVARWHGVQRMYSIDSPDNTAMRDLAAFLGFKRGPDPDDPHQVIHTLDLLAGA
jgi:GNAT superfamily N-acetyltransferase